MMINTQKKHNIVNTEKNLTRVHSTIQRLASHSLIGNTFFFRQIKIQIITQVRRTFGK